MEKPPIVEVVCGFVFDPLPIDGMLFGIYWSDREGDYPHHDLVPPVVDGPGTVLLGTHVRAMLTSADRAHIVQLQHDRFYVNWRANGAEYPRFSSRPGREGLLRRALDEFERFAMFCERKLQTRPSVGRVELTKIDTLRRGDYWSDLSDLATVVPITGAFGPVQVRGRRELALRFVEHRAPETIVVSLRTLHESHDGDVAAVQIETKVVHPLGESTMEGAFVEANRAANHAFMQLVPDLTRFGVRPRETP